MTHKHNNPFKNDLDESIKPEDAINNNSSNDFGKNIIPQMLKENKNIFWKFALIMGIYYAIEIVLSFLKIYI